MKKQQFLVLGLGRFGSSVARALSELGHEVLAVDSNEDAVDAIEPYVTQAVVADAADEEALRELDVASFDVAIVAIGSRIRESILMSVLCKEAGVRTVIAKATDELHAKILRKVGVDRVIFPERDMAQRLARSLVMPGILDFMELTGDYKIAEVMAPDMWSGRTLIDINVRRKYGLSIVAIRREGAMIASPGADTELERGDVLLVLGKQRDIDALEGL